MNDLHSSPQDDESVAAETDGGNSDSNPLQKIWDTLCSGYGKLLEWDHGFARWLGEFSVPELRKLPVSLAAGLAFVLAFLFMFQSFAMGLVLMAALFCAFITGRISMKPLDAILNKP